VTRVRFRRSGAVMIAGLVAFFAAVPLASTRWYLTPILLVPLALGCWGWRAGTDADPSGVSVRALFGRRRLGWGDIAGFVRDNRQVRAVLAVGGEVPLPGVTPGDLPRLVAAGGQELLTAGGAEAVTNAPAADRPAPDRPEPGQERPDQPELDQEGPDQPEPGQAGPAT
jgi:Bacterial PH domain